MIDSNNLQLSVGSWHLGLECTFDDQLLDMVFSKFEWSFTGECTLLHLPNNYKNTLHTFVNCICLVTLLYIILRKPEFEVMIELNSCKLQVMHSCCLQAYLLIPFLPFLMISRCSHRISPAVQSDIRPRKVSRSRPHSSLPCRPFRSEPR